MALPKLGHTNAGSAIFERSTKLTSPAKALVAAWAAAIATVVLPMPPDPTIVRRRRCWRVVTRVAITSSRPTMTVPRAGNAFVDLAELETVFGAGARHSTVATNVYPLFGALTM